MPILVIAVGFRLSLISTPAFKVPLINLKAYEPCCEVLSKAKTQNKTNV